MPVQYPHCLPCLPACLPSTARRFVCLCVCPNVGRPSVPLPPSVCVSVCLRQSVSPPASPSPAVAVRPSVFTSATPKPSPPPQTTTVHQPVHCPPLLLPLCSTFMHSLLHSLHPRRRPSSVVRRPSSIVRRSVGRSVGRPQRIVSPKAKSASPNDIHTQD